MGMMDYYILSYHHWKGKGGKTLHLAAGVNAFLDVELDIRMTKEQAIIFLHTPECWMLHDAAERDMLAKATPEMPREDPPPPRTRFLSNWEFIALEAYRKYKTYVSLKNYSDFK